MNKIVKSTVSTLLIALVGANFTGCTLTKSPTPPPPPPPKEVKPTPPPPPPVVPQLSEEQKQLKYKESMKKVGAKIKSDANYKKLDLSTPELKEWFTDITYKLWDNQITQEQFIATGLEKFPNRRYEFETISYGLLSR